MGLTINQDLFEGVKRAIAETGRIDMQCWAGIAGDTVSSVDEISRLSLSDDCGTTACIGGWACYLAGEDAIAGVVRRHGLHPYDAQEPAAIAATLLLDSDWSTGELEEACHALFHLKHWPAVERQASDDSQTAAERVQVVLRRMDNWATEIATLSATDQPATRQSL